jgi:DnaK suppressor protein
MRSSQTAQHIRDSGLDDCKVQLTAVLDRIASGHRAGFLTRQVLEALERIDNGNYGLCLNCGQPIPPKRLAALPWVAFCVTCQEETETREI